MDRIANFSKRNGFARQAARRWGRNLYRAFKALDEGCTVRSAAQKFLIAPSTLHYRYERQKESRFRRNMPFTEEEEESIVRVLETHSIEGRPVSRNDLQDLVELLASSFPEQKKKSLRFKNGSPGRAFCTGFGRRHAERIRFKKPSKQEATRYKATNSEVLVQHFANLSTLIKQYDLDARRIFNLDETGVALGREDRHCSQKKVYAIRGGNVEVPGISLQNVNRISLLVCANALGNLARPLFIFHGTRVRIRELQHKNEPGKVWHETIGNCLPGNSLFAARQGVAGVGSASFFKWVKYFIDDVDHLTKDGRKVFLIYDGYRSHMSLAVLELMAQNGIIADALPAHTSGTTQPLDVSIFGPFKNAFRINLDIVVAGRRQLDSPLSEFDIATIITRSYEEATIPANIKAGFSKTTIWPLDEVRLFGKARPASAKNLDKIVSVEDMIALLDRKRAQAAEDILPAPKITRDGFLEASAGAVLTTEAALGLLKLQETRRMNAIEHAKAKEAQKEAKELETYKRTRSARLSMIWQGVLRRNLTYGMPQKWPRDMKIRRAKAMEPSRRRYAQQENENFNSVVLAEQFIQDETRAEI